MYDRVIRALPLRAGVVVAVALATCGSALAQGTAAQNRPAEPNSPPAATEAPAPAAQASTEDATQALAVAAQNPIAAMYSLPFQNNTFFGVGPNHNQAANLLNIQPVLPFNIGDWNIISRTITPLISLPSLTPGNLGDVIAGAASANDPFGLGDINQTFYFSPAAAKDFIWGAGPSVSLPTATTRALGSNTLAIGPAAVALVTPKPWVIGTLVRQLWSVTGPNKNVDQTLLQPFINYNLPEGWYLTSSPIITANWSAPSAQRWNVPLGGGVGKIFKIYGQPMNASLQAFDFVATPSLGRAGNSASSCNFCFRNEVDAALPSGQPPRVALDRSTAEHAELIDLIRGLAMQEASPVPKLRNVLSAFLPKLNRRPISDALGIHPGDTVMREWHNDA